jgi:hypothetical protein
VIADPTPGTYKTPKARVSVFSQLSHFLCPRQSLRMPHSQRLGGEVRLSQPHSQPSIYKLFTSIPQPALKRGESGKPLFKAAVYTQIAVHCQSQPTYPNPLSQARGNRKKAAYSSLKAAIILDPSSRGRGAGGVGLRAIAKTSY